MPDLLYSFGTLHPGLVTLHNFPKFLQEFERPDGQLQDLAATDILRCRELGVPRYNEFRRLLRLRPAADFLELTENREWAEQIQWLYDGDIEKVDSWSGCTRRNCGRIRLQRHGVPHLHPDGLAAAEQRPLLHRVLHPRGVLQGRYGLDRRQLHDHGAAAPPPGAAYGSGGADERFVPWNTAGRTMT